MTTGPHDPTRSGPPPPAAATVRFSRNEIETLSMKAARGAGMSWGLAEEAGFAAGWLAAQGIDGAGALLGLLDEGADRAALRPVVSGDCWQATGGRALCPIALGAALSDHGALPDGPLAVGALRTGPVSRPILVLPFLALLAESAGGAVSLTWPRGALTVGSSGVWPIEAARRLSAEAAATLEIGRAAALSAALAPRPLFEVSGATVAGLNALAMRTTVPASEASRRGAGATASDND